MEDTELKYSVTAITDLIGFSRHLEAGNYDLRTTIGKEAIKRLETLEESIRLLRNERKSHKSAYPKNLKLQRINDAIIFTIDLPKLFLPSVGETIIKGFSALEIGKHFDLDELDNLEKFEQAYYEKLVDSTIDLGLFVGLISRVHKYVNNIEAKHSFPGAKSVIATGLRLPFKGKGKKEDFFSANFSFSNAYIAERSLKGPLFFVDDNILRLLFANKYFKNIIRFASFIYKEAGFNPHADYDDILYPLGTLLKSKPIKVDILKKTFAFRQLNTTPLNYLQTIPFLEPFLVKKTAPKCKDGIWLGLLSNIKSGPSSKNISGDFLKPASIINKASVPLDQSIKIFPNMLHNRKPYRKKMNSIIILPPDKDD